jgi:hypothetical protein
MSNTHSQNSSLAAIRWDGLDNNPTQDRQRGSSVARAINASAVSSSNQADMALDWLEIPGANSPVISDSGTIANFSFGLACFIDSTCSK